MRGWAAIGVLAAGAALAGTAQAAPGDLDETFSRDGLVRIAGGSAPSAVGVQDDGGVLTLTGAYSDGSTLRRYLPNGDPDRTFGNGGVVALPGKPGFFELAVAPDGLIVVAGTDWDAAGSRFVVMRLHPDGAPDGSFGGNGRATVDFAGHGRLGALALAPDGSILLAGTGYSDEVLSLARLDGNGALDPTFSGDGKQELTPPVADPPAEVGGATVAADGSAYVGWGQSSIGQYTGRVHVVKLTPAGEPDPAYGDGGIASSTGDGPVHAVDDLELDRGDRVLFAGTPCAGLRVVCFATVGRFTTAGEPDGAFAGDGTAVWGGSGARAVLPRPDGRVLVAGSAPMGSPTDDDYALRMLTGSGTADEDFADAGLATTDSDFGYDLLYDADLTPDGDVVAVGLTDLVRYDMAAGPADADADLVLDRADRCRKRFGRHRTGCPPFARELRTRRSASGTVRVRIPYRAGGPRECAAEQRIRLLRKRPGRDRVLAADRTSVRGRWRFSGAHGRDLYVRVPRSLKPAVGRCTRERERVPEGRP